MKLIFRTDRSASKKSGRRAAATLLDRRSDHQIVSSHPDHRCHPSCAPFDRTSRYQVGKECSDASGFEGQGKEGEEGGRGGNIAFFIIIIIHFSKKI